MNKRCCIYHRNCRQSLKCSVFFPASLSFRLNAEQLNPPRETTGNSHYLPSLFCFQRHYQKLLYPPRNRQMVVAGGSKTNSLHTYLHKLSHKRRVVEQRQRQRERVRFQLAHTTIREITQSSMGHRSNVQTAATSIA